MKALKKYEGISLGAIVALFLAAVMLFVGILLVRSPFSAGQFASNYFAAGEFARGVFASGEFSAGIFAAGTFAVGVFSIGIFSIGIFSVGLFVLAKYRKPLLTATDVAGAAESGSNDQVGKNC